MAPTTKVYHKKKSEMRGQEPRFFGGNNSLHHTTLNNIAQNQSCTMSGIPCVQQPVQPAPVMQCVQQCVQQPVQPAPVMPCVQPPHVMSCTPCVSQNLCQTMVQCKYAPYYCFSYRNVSLWCEYCMSRRMFPEHYPYDARYFIPGPPPCSDVYYNGQYIMPPRIQSCPSVCSVSQSQSCPVSCPVPQFTSQSCPVPQSAPQTCAVPPSY